MRKILHLLFFLGLNLFLQAQTELSGVINDYRSVSSIDYCENTLIVDDAMGFEENDAVILIQMTGATINNENNSNFGDIIDLGSTGLFEQGAIQSINGNEITLQNPLLNQYDTDFQVQLVRIPIYENAVVNSLLTAQAWDGTTGGVLAFEVTGTLTLNANISVDALGFEGGTGDITVPNDCGFVTNANDYFYDANNWRGASKGSGIAPFLANQDKGRGAQANGGGGGNDHNAGGGGGAHLTKGGKGGENREPAFFGCDGNFPGEGGKALDQDSTRVYLGGGGGAGHENNNLNPVGGQGGGIILIKANFIIGNNQDILASGESPATVNGDGAGGGGAGGTIILLADGGEGTLNLIAQGGKGGDADNSSENRCMGPGGGGSGGRILTNDLGNLNITASIDGGDAGNSTNSSNGNCPNGSNGAQNGTDGFVEMIHTIPQSMEINSPPTILSQDMILNACEGDILDISTEVQGFQLDFQWQIDSGSGFVNLEETSPYSNTMSPVLNIDPVDHSMEAFSYRLLITSDCFESITSQSVSISIEEAPSANFSFLQTGDFSFDFTNSSTNANEYFWDFGDMNTSILENPSHTYDEEGTYTVSLTVTNDCGSNTFSEIIIIAGAPTAGFDFSPESGCSPLSVQFNNLSSPNVSSFAWFFDGGTPSFSLDENPVVEYNTPGIYGALLIVSNSSGTDSLSLENIITIQEEPIANFSFTVNDLEVSFDNNAENANSYLWDFGDMSNSDEENPIHTFPEAGTYTVTLTAIGPCGEEDISQTITVGAPPMASFSSNVVKACAPFPVQFTNQSSGTYDQINWSFPGGMPNSSIEENPTIIYTTPGNYSVSLSVDGPLGGNTSNVVDYIEIIPVPEPIFSFIILDGGTVIFNNESTDADSYIWDFGDNNNSTEFSPVHTYNSSGVFTVTLNASNPFCAKAASMDVVIVLTSIEEVKLSKAFLIFPNPSSGKLEIQSKQKEILPTELSIFNLQGQQILSTFFNKNIQLQLNTYPKGMYLMRLSNKNGQWQEKIILK